MLTEAEIETVESRADVITYTVLAEMEHFQRNRVVDFEIYMQRYLHGQIAFYRQVAYITHCFCFLQNIIAMQGLYELTSECSQYFSCYCVHTLNVNKSRYKMLKTMFLEFLVNRNCLHWRGGNSHSKTTHRPHSSRLFGCHLLCHHVASEL